MISIIFINRVRGYEKNVKIIAFNLKDERMLAKSKRKTEKKLPLFIDLL
jgi:hypothetical protein